MGTYEPSKWAIFELLFVSVSKLVLVLNYCKGNEFDLHKNTQLISIWMVVHQDSFWNWDMQQLGNGLLTACSQLNGFIGRWVHHCIKIAEVVGSSPVVPT